MTSVEQIKSRLPKRFSQVEIVSEDLLRGVEADHVGRIFASHYFTPVRDLSALAHNFSEFQDDLLGREFFESAGDLRWNQYLYLVTPRSDDDGWRNAKSKIESDRSYARKFVLQESEIERFFRDQTRAAAPDKQKIRGGIVESWTSKLISHGLDVVLEQRAITETVRLIADGSFKRTETNQIKRAEIDSRSHLLGQAFIRKMKVERFRRKLDGREFDFGDVNVIVGPNGVGKTSLLEAIEFLYCGDNARHSLGLPANVRAKYDGVADWVAPEQEVAELKKRNLHWYGVRDLRRSTLVNSFSRFNFLSTDEAVLMGVGERDDIDDLLSRIVSGPQAADLWSHICRTKDAVVVEVTTSSNRLGRLVAERKAEEERVSSSAEGPGLAELALVDVHEDLARVGWRGEAAPSTVPGCIQQLRKASSLTRQLVSGEWLLPSSLSPAQIKKSKKEAEKAKAVASGALINILRLEQALASKRLEQDTLGRKKVALQRISSFVSTGVLRTIREIAKVQTSINEKREYLSDDAPRAPLSWYGYKANDPMLSDIPRCDTMSAEELAALESEIERRRRSVADLDSELATLLNAGAHLIESGLFKDNCPLCMTAMEHHELRERIQRSRDNPASEELAQLIVQLNHAKSVSARSMLSCGEIEHLRAYAVRRQLELSAITVGEVAKDLGEQRLEVEVLSARLSELTRLQDRHESDGMRLHEFELATRQARDLGVDVSESKLTEQLADVVRQEIECFSEISALREQLASIEQDARQRLVDLSSGQGADVREMVAFSDRRMLLAQEAFEALVDLEDILNVREETSLHTLEPLLRAAVSSGEKYLAIVASSAKAQGHRAEAISKLAGLKEQVSREADRLGRLREASACLNDLVENESLPGATEDQLVKTKAQMQAIFSAIHTPHEYEVYKGLKEPLRRIGDPHSVSGLNEISTGQRAAFVLSLFLAMNSQLDQAPKILLFDDPIAHIDDFNALSFIDHLRQLSISGRRQIFYATADSRIAGLMQHKFSFLGDRFAKIDVDLKDQN